MPRFGIQQGFKDEAIALEARLKLEFAKEIRTQSHGKCNEIIDDLTAQLSKEKEERAAEKATMEANFKSSMDDMLAQQSQLIQEKTKELRAQNDKLTSDLKVAVTCSRCADLEAEIENLKAVHQEELDEAYATMDAALGGMQTPGR